MRIRGILAAVLLSTFAVPTLAQDITIGVGVPPGTMDPHLSWLSSDTGYYRNVYEALYETDTKLVQHPQLALGHTLIDDVTWEFTLRQGVKFHDGTDFDAHDVVSTFARVGTVAGSDGLVADLLAPIEKVEALGSHKLRVITREPIPDLIRRITVLLVLPSELPANTLSEAFSNPEIAVGTGAMKMAEWKRGTGMTLIRNDNYWGEKSVFETVELKEISSDAARIAALRAGDVDMVDYVPPLDAKTLEAAQGIKVWTTPSARVIYLLLNSAAETAPMTSGKDGSALEKNPFSDINVRQALNLAIDRGVLVSRVLEGLAFEANQLVPEGLLAYNENIPRNTYDIESAKKLLADAGFADGFATTIACPSDRYIKDATICQAAGQMFSRIGLEVTVETMPKAIYFARMLKSEFPIAMLGWGNNDGTGASVFTSVLHSRDEETGFGSWNPAYSDIALDGMIEEALTTMDADLYEERMKAVMAMAVEKNVALLPLHAQPVIAATRAGLKYVPSADEQMLVRNISIAE